MLEAVRGRVPLHGRGSIIMGGTEAQIPRKARTGSGDREGERANDII